MSNAGDAYLLGKKRTKKGLLGSDFNEINVLKYNSEKGDQKYILTFEKDKLEITEASLLERKEGGVRMLAFAYKIGFLNGRMEGILVVDLDENLNEVSRSYQDLDFDDYLFDDEKTNPKKSKDDARSQKLLELRREVSYADGSSILIGEQYAVIERRDPSGGGINGMSVSVGTTTYIYMYNDLVAMKFDPEGKLEWARLIPKRQTFSTPLHLGTAFMETEDKLYMLFNDDIRNLDKDKKKVFSYGKDYKKGGLVAVTLDVKSGAMSKELIFNLKANETRVVPSQHYQISDNELVIFAKRKKEDKVVIVKVD